MNDVVAFIDKDDVFFYDKHGNTLVCDDLDNCVLHTVLPDEFFFFFQSDITSKRKAHITVEAYAKSIFPVENAFVGYMSDTLPLIGYICFYDKIPEKIMHILEKSKTVITPFAIYFNKFKESGFVYKGQSVWGVYDKGNLQCYGMGDKCPIEKDDISNKVKQVDYVKEDVLKLMWDMISSNSTQKINLPVTRNTQNGFENWKISRFVLIVVMLLLFIAGGVFRYSYYKKELTHINHKIALLYKKALGDKHYTDPYGVLLYKADSANASGYAIAPMELFYAISKAKANENIKIDYVSFDNNGIKIEGKADNYASVVKYADNINALLKKKFIIQNTSYANGKLLFGLVYSAVMQ